VGAFLQGCREIGQPPNETQRCHSVRDSHASSEFFHARCAATENAVKVDPLLIVFVSASPPMNPMRVSLLRYIVFFPVLPACPGALKSERPPLPRQEAAFLGGPEWGSQNRNGVVRRSRSFEDRRAREFGPKLCPGPKGRSG